MALFDAFGSIVLVLGVLTFFAIILYLFYGGLYRTFQRVGFTNQEAGLILLGTFFGAFIDIPLFPYNGWEVGINVGGALVPLTVTYLLLRRQHGMILELMAATTVVALVTYLVTGVHEFGIASPFPLYLLPPLAAAAMSLGAFWREENFAAPLAYMSGTLGAIIGADVFRLPEFLSQTPPPEGTGFASIGGAAVLDMVYLTGVLAVALDALFFSQVHRHAKPAELPYEGGLVFTVSTPSEVIANYTPAPRGVADVGTLAERPREASPRPPHERARTAPPRPPQRTAPTSPRPTAPPSTTGEDPRLARHREWEERLRGGRT